MCPPTAPVYWLVCACRCGALATTIQVLSYALGINGLLKTNKAEYARRTHTHMLKMPLLRRTSHHFPTTHARTHAGH